MSLLQEGMEPCRLMEKKRVPDGEGGLITSWQEGPEFMAAIVCDQSLEARAAEKEGLTSLYTVTCAKGAKLEYHDVFKRLEDGKIFRVTSDGDDKTTPERASFQVSQVTAEKWELSARADGQTTRLG